MWNADTNHDPTIYMFEIEKIIDEAKKEFPDYRKEHGRIGVEYSEYELWQNCLRELNEINTWYEKWFGK